MFGMHTQLMTPFQMTQGQWPCGLDFDLEAKNRFFDFVAAGGIMFYKHTLIFDYPLKL